MSENLMDKIVSLCKRRGFIFQSSEIYGGLANTWDYGPYGVELKNNIKQAWWRRNVWTRDDMVGMDAAILMDPDVWRASGHTDNFFDVMLDCNKCKKIFRIDKVKERYGNNIEIEIQEDPKLGKVVMSTTKGKLKCLEPNCDGELGIPRKFNLMFKTFIGSLEDFTSAVYLRPETAQGIFVNFPNIVNVSRKKLPFGVAQIGKAFRNEITPGNFTFRTREFEQMEIEYFVNPKEADKYYKEWVDERFSWYLKFGIKKDNLRKREHLKDELAHYAASCTDIEYNFPFGWSELEGIANRRDFDLRKHNDECESGRSLTYPDLEDNDGFPYIIEPSGGVDRATLAFLVDAYFEEKVKDETRAVLKFHKDLAPTKVAVFPLLKNRPQLVETAKNITLDLKKKFVCVYDDTAAIGKLYRRQDEVGTLFCVTVDVQSLEDKKVTVRSRDTMLQDRVNIEQLENYLTQKLQ